MTIALPTKIGRTDQAMTFIENRKLFRTSSALTVESGAHGAGRLPAASLAAFGTDQAHRTIDYVVYSYATPIAWHTAEDGWAVVTDKFSPTTTNHQHLVRMALRRQLVRPVGAGSYPA
jgi:hypothetical protein